MLITLERYIAVCAPHSSWKLAKRSTVITQILLFVISIGINIPRAWEYEPTFKASTGQWVQAPSNLKRSSTYGTYVTVQYWVIQLAIPIATISYMTVMILKKLKLTTQRKRTGLTKSLMTVNIIYIFVQVINGIRRILVVILSKEEVTLCEKPYSYFYGITTFPKTRQEYLVEAKK
ncbi:DgyrCDS1960 [Dimorphilus gyrociliatus]|uniref:DgyrCDS1960 n=1 Tax=Dimorphilus gyrociliatus TaxID=2664684 RepID=A0A7I8V8S5_9ANNE|nr:DgyrCDS1960 [Dimorphilus gyrociliatus]